MVTEPTETFADSRSTAGTVLLMYSVTGLLLYVVVGKAMWRYAAITPGYRYLLSQGLGEMLLLIQFGVWPGIVILRAENFFPEHLRFAIHVVLDYNWWAVAYHYSVVAWSRMMAVRDPLTFKLQPWRKSLSVCLLPWVVAAIQTTVTHLHPDFVITYLDPDQYGYVFTNFTLYEQNHVDTYYAIFNYSLFIVIPCVLYILAIYNFARTQKRINAALTRVADDKPAESNQPPAQRSSMTSDSASVATRRMLLRVEISLLLPCLLNNMAVIIGQYTITHPMVSDQWFAWFVVMAFTTQSFLNPLLYFICSRAIRYEVLCILCLADRGEDG